MILLILKDKGKQKSVRSICIASLCSQLPLLIKNKRQCYTIGKKVLNFSSDKGKIKFYTLKQHYIDVFFM